MQCLKRGRIERFCFVKCASEEEARLASDLLRTGPPFFWPREVIESTDVEWHHCRRIKVNRRNSVAEEMCSVVMSAAMRYIQDAIDPHAYMIGKTRAIVSAGRVIAACFPDLLGSLLLFAHATDLRLPKNIADGCASAASAVVGGCTSGPREATSIFAHERASVNSEPTRGVCFELDAVDPKTLKDVSPSWAELLALDLRFLGDKGAGKTASKAQGKGKPKGGRNNDNDNARVNVGGPNRPLNAVGEAQPIRPANPRQFPQHNQPLVQGNNIQDFQGQQGGGQCPHGVNSAPWNRIDHEPPVSVGWGQCHRDEGIPRYAGAPQNGGYNRTGQPPHIPTRPRPPPRNNAHGDANRRQHLTTGTGREAANSQHSPVTVDKHGWVRVKRRAVKSTCATFVM